MRERVEFIPGHKPIILVAPHGAQCDDFNTDVIVETAAKRLDCFAIINRGFEKCKSVDVLKDQADCNRIDHLKKNVVREEFLDPLMKTKNKIRMNLRTNPIYDYVGNVLIISVLGCDDSVNQLAHEQVEMVVGYGRGKKKDSTTCGLWRKNLFVDIARTTAAHGGDVFEGKGDGKFAGRNSNDLNQYFRKHKSDRRVDCLQLHVPPNLRDTVAEAGLTGIWLKGIIDMMDSCTSYDNDPHPKFV